MNVPIHINLAFFLDMRRFLLMILLTKWITHCFRCACHEYGTIYDIRSTNKPDNK